MNTDVIPALHDVNIFLVLFRRLIDELFILTISSATITIIFGFFRLHFLSFGSVHDADESVENPIKISRNAIARSLLAKIIFSDALSSVDRKKQTKIELMSR